MTAARPRSAAPAGPFVFLSCSGPHALAELCAELARRRMQPQDLLRLRSFAAAPDGTLGLERELQELLPRSQWPALTSVELDLPQLRGQAIDAIAAQRAHRQRELVQPGKTLRFGDWVFVGALSGADAARQPLRDRIAVRIEHQARSLFERMQAALASAGAELRDVLKVGGWLRFPMSEYEPLGEVRGQLLERARLFPASAAVQVGAPAGPNATLLAFEAIAFTRREQARAATAASSLAPYYASARRADCYVFASGEIARRPAPVCAQVDDVYEQLREHVSAHGGSLRSVVHQTVYVRRPRDLATVEERMRAWLGCRPPTTAIHALDIGFRKGVDVEIELVVRAR